MSELESPWRGDFKMPLYTYLNNSVITLSPYPVEQAEIDAMRDPCIVGAGRSFKDASMPDPLEKARENVASFINGQPNEVVFVSNTTEALNFVASAWGRQNLCRGDHVLITDLEHHSNIVAWRILESEIGIHVDVLPITAAGDLDLAQLQTFITLDTKLFSFTAVSNVLGTVNPVAEIIAAAKKINSRLVTCVDAAQAAGHGLIDVKEWGCDFTAFSGQKMYGPTGLGILYGRDELLSKLKPINFGGGMIESLEPQKFVGSPHCFEYGTPNSDGIMALSAAIEYIRNCGIENVQRYESLLTRNLVELLNSIDGVAVIGDPQKRSTVVPFKVASIAANNVAETLWNKYHIMIRSGVHCALPLIKKLNQGSLCRASVALYTDGSDIARLGDAMRNITGHRP